MKKLLYTLLAVTIIFSACEKEEESSSNNNSNNNNGSGNPGNLDPTDGTEYEYRLESIDEYTERFNGTFIEQCYYLVKFDNTKNRYSHVNFNCEVEGNPNEELYLNIVYNDNNIIRIEYNDGLVEEYIYNNGKIATWTVLSDGTLVEDRNYEYDSNNNLITLTDSWHYSKRNIQNNCPFRNTINTNDKSDITTRTFYYDNENVLIAETETDESGFSTERTYNYQNNIQTVSDIELTREWDGNNLIEENSSTREIIYTYGTLSILPFPERYTNSKALWLYDHGSKCITQKEIKEWSDGELERHTIYTYNYTTID